MKKLCALPIILLLAILPEAPAVAQFVGIPTTVAQLPDCTVGRNGRIWIVRDGDTMVDCSSGGGTAIAVCVCSNLSFVPLAAATVEDLAASYVQITKAGQQSITASGAGNDFTGTVADDWILSISDDYSATCQDYSVAAGASAVVNVAAGADEISVTAGKVDIVSCAFLGAAANTTGKTCDAGAECDSFWDSTAHAICYCNGTAWKLGTDGSTNCTAP